VDNLIPEWNDLVYRGRWREALDRLHKTNNFPEFTGRVCPAPCEGACCLGVTDPPVTIKNIECTIVDRGFEEGWIVPEPPTHRTGKSVAVVGSGPCGLAAADQLNRAGHRVTVFERADRIGGLLRYGIPEFKLEKGILDRRLKLMKAEGVTFRVKAEVGVNVSVEEMRSGFDAVVLAGGAPVPRDLKVPGRELEGIHFAMEYLPQANRRCEGDTLPEATLITAKCKRVVVIGGGDTGGDCLGTAHRQGAALVTQFEVLPRPPASRAADNPWPLWPNIFRVSTAHEEGGERDYCIATKRFSGREGKVERLHGVRVEFAPGPNGRPAMRELPAQVRHGGGLVLLAGIPWAGAKHHTRPARRDDLERDGGGGREQDDRHPRRLAAGDTARPSWSSGRSARSAGQGG
jgi:glutamate synthase (NADPH/NADH) small chain